MCVILIIFIYIVIYIYLYFYIFIFLFCRCNWLAFPTLSTFKTRDKCRHWLICRTRLLLSICALVRLASATCKQIGGCFNLQFVPIFVTIFFILNYFAPHFRIHVLVCHKCKFVRFNFFSFNHIHDVLIIEVDAYAFQPIHIQLNKIHIVPLFNNIHFPRFQKSAVINSPFQI